MNPVRGYEVIGSSMTTTSGSIEGTIGTRGGAATRQEDPKSQIRRIPERNAREKRRDREAERENRERDKLL